MPKVRKSYKFIQVDPDSHARFRFLALGASPEKSITNLMELLSKKTVEEIKKFLNIKK